MNPFRTLITALFACFTLWGGGGAGGGGGGGGAGGGGTDGTQSGAAQEKKRRKDARQAAAKNAAPKPVGWDAYNAGDKNAFYDSALGGHKLNSFATSEAKRLGLDTSGYQFAYASHRDTFNERLKAAYDRDVANKKYASGETARLKEVNPSSKATAATGSRGRGIIKNPARAGERRKARIGGSTQYEVPTLGVSGARK